MEEISEKETYSYLNVRSSSFYLLYIDLFKDICMQIASTHDLKGVKGELKRIFFL